MYRNKIFSFFLLILFSIVTLVPSPAYACWWGDYYPHKTSLASDAANMMSTYDNSKKDGSSFRNLKTAGDPVYLHNGDFVYTNQDLFIPGRGLNLELTRTYKAMSRYNGPMGLGWDFNYNKRVVLLSNSDIDYLDGENTIIRFTYSGGEYIVPNRLSLALTRNGDGTVAIRYKNGNKELYNANGTLSRIEDRNGNYLSFSYDPAGKLPIIGVPVFWAKDAVTPRLVACSTLNKCHLIYRQVISLYL